jgi:hypothetical protein
MILGSILAVCSIGLLASIYKIFEYKFINQPGTINLLINDKDFAIDYNKDDASYNIAIAFCSREGSKLGFDISNFEQCTTPLLSAFNERDRKGKKGRLSKINLSMKPTPSKDRLTQKKNSEDAVEKSAAASSSSVPMVPKSLKLPLEINGITYVFEYIPSADSVVRRDAADKLASAFCASHGKELIDEKAISKAAEAAAIKATAAGESMESEEFSAQMTKLTAEMTERLLSDECRKPISGALYANMQRSAPDDPSVSSASTSDTGTAGDGDAAATATSPDSTSTSASANDAM